MVPDQYTKTEQGTWPTETMVSMCPAVKPTCRGWLGCWTSSKQKLKKEPYKLRGQEISSRLEMSPKRKPLAKAHALFCKGLKVVKGDESKIHVVCGKIQISFLIGSAMAAK